MTKALAAPSIPSTSPFIPFPALYVDQIMPGLSDTEWRILCVVIRKGRDWLSHRQLKERTGKSTDSVSRGIQSLIELNLIVVEREDGTLIHHPKARRRERARLYFKLAALPGAQEEASRSDSQWA
jgi:DNA-binding transcriptional regulator YhcF (GntR family)